MLKGKIISIEYKGNWHLTIDRHRKQFITFEELESYLILVLSKAKDEHKKALLHEDMEKLFHEIPDKIHKKQ